MKDFGRWFTEQGAAEVAQPIEEDEPDDGLPEGVYIGLAGKLHAYCRVCDRDYTVYPGEIKDFDQNMSYCGGSPRCCP